MLGHVGVDLVRRTLRAALHAPKVDAVRFGAGQIVAGDLPVLQEAGQVGFARARQAHKAGRIPVLEDRHQLTDQRGSVPNGVSATDEGHGPNRFLLWTTAYVVMTVVY